MFHLSALVSIYMNQVERYRKSTSHLLKLLCLASNEVKLVHSLKNLLELAGHLLPVFELAKVSAELSKLTIIQLL